MKPEFLRGKNFILLKVKVEILNYCNFDTVRYPRKSLPEVGCLEIIALKQAANQSKQEKGSLRGMLTLHQLNKSEPLNQSKHDTSSVQKENTQVGNRKQSTHLFHI